MTIMNYCYSGTSGYLSLLERGIKANPSLITMKKIADALECEIADIFK